MGRVSLERKDGQPLTFEGSLIVEASTRASDGALWSRWNEVAIYKHCEGYAVAIRYRSIIPGDPEEDMVEVCADNRSLALELHTYGPGGYFGHTPANLAEYLTQARIYSKLRAAYYCLINQLLGREDFAILPRAMPGMVASTETRTG